MNALVCAKGSRQVLGGRYWNLRAEAILWQERHLGLAEIMEVGMWLKELAETQQPDWGTRDILL